jgi:hypothetical protein
MKSEQSKEKNFQFEATASSQKKRLEQKKVFFVIFETN